MHINDMGFAIGILNISLTKVEKFPIQLLAAEEGTHKQASPLEDRIEYPSAPISCAYDNESISTPNSTRFRASSQERE